MLLDRTSLYLIFAFGAERISGLAISLSSLNDSSSVPTSSSIQHAVAQTTKPYPSQNGKLVSPLSSSLWSPAGSEDTIKRSSYTPIAVSSALSIATPGSPSNPVFTSPLAKSHHTSIQGNSASLASASESWLSLAQATQSWQPAGQQSNVISSSSHTSSAILSVHTLAEAFDVLKVQRNSTTSVSADLANTAGGIVPTATMSGSNLSNIILTTSISGTASESHSPTTANVLSILFSALPSSVAEPLESSLNRFTHNLGPDSTTTQHTRSHRPTNHPTTHPKIHPTTHPMTPPTTPPTTMTTSTTSSFTTTSTPTSISSTHSTMTGTIESTRSSTAAPPSVGSHPISNASVAGIATGFSAGAVLVVLGGVFLWRRRQQGKTLFGRSASQRSAGSGRVYPEVAWLYDPQITPAGSRPHSRSGSGADEMLIPGPRPGSGEMEGGASPNLGPHRPSSPLLVPQLPLARDESPGGSPGSSGGRRSRSSLGASQERRPLTAIFEEPPVR